MPKDTHKKIALVTRSLAGGGAERSTAVLSTLFTNLGHEVHIITIVGGIDYEYAGTLFNAGDYKSGRNDIVGKIKSLIGIRNYIKKENFDWVIDNRGRSSGFKEIMYSKFIFDLSKTILVVRSHNLDIYFPKSNMITRYCYKNVHTIIGVSQGISKAVQDIFGFSQVQTIYNPIPQLDEEALKFELPENYILSYGRIIDDVKNYKLLISAFAKAKINKPLIIMGDGPDVEMLQRFAKSLQMVQKVIFIPKQSSIKRIVEQADFVVLSSYYEGFPMVLVESLSLGVPVVSVNCDSGPSELINDGINGLLVANHDPDVLSDALVKINNDRYRLEIKKHTKESVAHLQQSIIAKQWQKLLTSNE